MKTISIDRRICEISDYICYKWYFESLVLSLQFEGGYYEGKVAQDIVLPRWMRNCNKIRITPADTEGCITRQRVTAEELDTDNRVVFGECLHLTFALPDEYEPDLYGKWVHLRASDLFGIVKKVDVVAKSEARELVLLSDGRPGKYVRRVFRALIEEIRTDIEVDVRNLCFKQLMLAIHSKVRVFDIKDRRIYLFVRELSLALGGVCFLLDEPVFPEDSVMWRVQSKILGNCHRIQSGRIRENTLKLIRFVNEPFRTNVVSKTIECIRPYFAKEMDLFIGFLVGKRSLFVSHFMEKINDYALLGLSYKILEALHQVYSPFVLEKLGDSSCEEEVLTWIMMEGIHTRLERNVYDPKHHFHLYYSKYSETIRSYGQN